MFTRADANIYVHAFNVEPAGNKDTKYLNALTMERETSKLHRRCICFIN